MSVESEEENLLSPVVLISTSNPYQSINNVFLQDQFGRNKVPEWQRVAGKAAKEVEKFAKEKADIVLMHWRDKMGITQKEVSDVCRSCCYYCCSMSY